MQASNIFTVGGSLGPNIHGNDPNYGAIIETVRSFRLMQANGEVIKVSRSENAELFSLVIGGYGLFGVIIDVDLEFTDDVIYEMTSYVMDYRKYPEFFKATVLGNEDIGLHSAKLSNAPRSLLTEVIETTYKRSDVAPNPSIYALENERDVFRNRLFFSLSRSFGWGKDLRWSLQKRLIAKVGKTEYVSRNNAMRPIIKFLDYSSSKNTDILQEYFVPIDQFIKFIDGLRAIIKEDNVNLLSITLRYVPQDDKAFMPYAKSDVISVVLYINQGLDDVSVKKAAAWTRRMVELSLSLEGTYYLAYQRYPTKEQLLKAYPEFTEFINKKRQYDPDELFMNTFYEHYR
jgi:decaprenylphospho-beta-D-ribofuranose 2-oxidase